MPFLAKDLSFVAEFPHPMRLHAYTSFIYRGIWLGTLSWFTIAFGQEESPWSFRPLIRPDIPKIESSDSWCENAIDRFIQKALTIQGLTPSPEAPPQCVASILSQIEMPI